MRRRGRQGTPGWAVQPPRTGPAALSARRALLCALALDGAGEPFGVPHVTMGVLLLSDVVATPLADWATIGAAPNHHRLRPTYLLD